MLTLDSGSVSLSRSARGDSVQTIWRVGRHSNLLTIDTTVLCWMTVAPLGMFLRAYLFDTYLLIFEGHASWSQSLDVCCMVSFRYYWVCRPGKICIVCFCRLHWCGKCSASTGLNWFSCFSQQGQDLLMNIFFCQNAFLSCNSISRSMPAIHSCFAIRLRHVLRL